MPGLGWLRFLSVESDDVTKQCVPLTLDAGSDVRKTCSCGDLHIAGLVVPPNVHNQSLIAHVQGLHLGWFTFGQSQCV